MSEGTKKFTMWWNQPYLGYDLREELDRDDDACCRHLARMTWIEGVEEFRLRRAEQGTQKPLINVEGMLGVAEVGTASGRSVFFARCVKNFVRVQWWATVRWTRLEKHRSTDHVIRMEGVMLQNGEGSHGGTQGEGGSERSFQGAS